ncbi:hypothetical protein EPO44_10550 [bacterium]|nr:MAG: hypothetical protein EPO44_10550 [bacterium]
MDTRNHYSMRGLWEWWKRVGKRIADIQARVLLTLFYFVVFSPFAIAVRLWSDPLTIKPGTPRAWRFRSDREGAPMERASRQF